MMHLILNITRITEMCQVNLEQFISEEFGFDLFRKSVLLAQINNSGHEKSWN